VRVRRRAALEQPRHHAVHAVRKRACADVPHAQRLVPLVRLLKLDRQQVQVLDALTRRPEPVGRRGAVQAVDLLPQAGGGVVAAGPHVCGTKGVELLGVAAGKAVCRGGGVPRKELGVVGGGPRQAADVVLLDARVVSPGLQKTTQNNTKQHKT